MARQPTPPGPPNASDVVGVCLLAEHPITSLNDLLRPLNTRFNQLLRSGTARFSPLREFMTRADYEGVCYDMRLADGTLWPMQLLSTEKFAKKLTPGTSKIALRDPD